MRLHDELYFEITVEGLRADVKRFISFVTSGELDDFFEITSDYIIYSDDFNTAPEFEKVAVTIANDDIGISIDSFNPEKFLDVFCSGGKNVSIHGNLFDIDDEEYCFTSPLGDTSYINEEDMEFLDELDEEARKEESHEDDDYE